MPKNQTEAPDNNQLVAFKDKIYYSISEVAAGLKINASMIRYWEDEFSHLRPKTNKKGDRRYRYQDVEALLQVYTLLKVKGLTIQGAKTFLGNKGTSQQKDIKSKMEELKSFLMAVKTAINQNTAVAIPSVDNQNANINTETTTNQVQHTDDDVNL